MFSSHSRSVSIIVSHKIPDLEVIDTHRTNDGRKVLVNVKLTSISKILSLISIYAPNNDNERTKFFEGCCNWIDKTSTDKSQIVMAGDFNTTYRAIDRPSGKIDKTSESFVDMMATLELLDTFAYLNEKQTKSTYIHPSIKSRNSHIE